MTPKNDKARKAWLAGLKDGDEAAWLDGDTYRIGTIRRDTEPNEFRLVRDRMVLGWFTAATGKGVRVERTEGWLVPATNEIKADIARRKRVFEARKRLSGRYYYGGFSDEQVLAAEAILWPEVKT